MKAIIFPGQGAQYVGMGKSFYDNYPESRRIFDAIDKALGFKLSDKCFTGSEEELKDTSLQQLAILAVSLAGFAALKTKNIPVEYFSGLSLGEYSCLYAAEVLSLEDVVLLVKERAAAMQSAAGKIPATMLAVIGLDKSALQEQAVKNNFYIANLNSPQQIVISLAVKDREKAKSSLEALGAKVVELAVSGGFHSLFMEPAKQQLSAVIEKLRFKPAKIPIVSNFTAAAHTDPEQIKFNLLNQLVSPVRWYECVQLIVSRGVTDFYEVGPSRVLKGLMRKIDSNVKVINIEKAEDL
jgi:[acyl-carrier-protein] S-malonyltransferase